MPYLILPFVPTAIGGAASAVTTVQTLDATTDKAEYVFHPPNGITITHLGFRYGTRTGTPPTYKISLQSVTDGVPTGTILGGGSPASGTFTPPASTAWNSTWQWVALDNAYTTTGAVIAIVIEYATGTVDGSNNGTFSVVMTNGETPTGTPYAIVNNAGSRTNQSNQALFGYKTASATYGFPIEAMTSTAFSSNSTPDEYAAKFKIPSTWFSTYSIRGVRVKWQSGAAGKTLLVQLYDTDGTTVLQNVTVDSDTQRAVGSVGYTEILFDESSLSSLATGSFYRIGFQAQEVTSSWAIPTLDVDSNAELTAFPLGIDCYLNTRTDGGSWTDDSTVNFRVPFMQLLIEAAAFSGGTTRGGTRPFRVNQR